MEIEKEIVSSLSSRRDKCLDLSVENYLAKLYTFIEHNGIESPGLFRISPPMDILSKQKKMIEKGDKIILQNNENYIHVACSLLKFFFRELSEPITTFKNYSIFIASVGVNQEERLSSIEQCLSLLPRINYRILRRLFQFLHQVSIHSDKNLMKSSNLAIVFAPCLLRSESESPEQIISDAPLAAAVVEYCIDFFHTLWPESLEKKASTERKVAEYKAFMEDKTAQLRKEQEKKNQQIQIKSQIFREMMESKYQLISAASREKLLKDEQKIIMKRIETVKTYHDELNEMIRLRCERIKSGEISSEVVEEFKNSPTHDSFLKQRKSLLLDEPP